MQRPALDYEHFLYHRRLRCIYAVVPKCGTTSIKHWFVATGAVDERPGFAGDVHDLLRATCSMDHLQPSEAADLFADPSVLKFTFVRDPWTRLVSGYVDKVAAAGRPALEFIRSKLKRTLVGRWQWFRHRLITGLEPLQQRGLTFREFVETLCSTRPETMNRHFRPQSCILANVELDFVGRLESFDVDFNTLLQRLGEATQPRAAHQQRYQGAAAGECVADWPAARLRELSEFPHWRQFYTPDLEQRVAEYFAADFARFGYAAKLKGLAPVSAGASVARIAA
jgi:hypothetical protein